MSISPLWRSVGLLLLGLAAGCAGTAAPPAQPRTESLLSRARVLWVAAHPDDEAMAGAVLARACVGAGGECHFVVFTRGAGGECLLPEGCKPDLGTVRHRELEGAARLYRATLEHYDFFNAPLPFSSFPSRPELERKWMAQGDPAGLVARAIRRFKPDLVITLDPSRGFTGHPEHQAAARFALAGARLAADAAAHGPLLDGEAPHRVTRVVQVLNRHWFMVVAGDPMDPTPFHEAMGTGVPCGVDASGRARTCARVAAANTRAHRSQDKDMDAIRSAARFWGTSYVRDVDPFDASVDPLLEELRAR